MTVLKSEIGSIPESPSLPKNRVLRKRFIRHGEREGSDKIYALLKTNYPGVSFRKQHAFGHAGFGGQGNRKVRESRCYKLSVPGFTLKQWLDRISRFYQESQYAFGSCEVTGTYGKKAGTIGHPFFHYGDPVAVAGNQQQVLII